MWEREYEKAKRIKNYKSILASHLISQLILAIHLILVLQNIPKAQEEVAPKKLQIIKWRKVKGGSKQQRPSTRASTGHSVRSRRMRRRAEVSSQRSFQPKTPKILAYVKNPSTPCVDGQLETASTDPSTGSVLLKGVSIQRLQKSFSARNLSTRCITRIDASCTVRRRNSPICTHRLLPPFP